MLYFKKWPMQMKIMHISPFLQILWHEQKTDIQYIYNKSIKYLCIQCVPIDFSSICTLIGNFLARQILNLVWLTRQM